MDALALLLDRIRVGDRDAAARFITENEGLIRRRYRHRLGRAVRRLVDSQELLSTIARRFDAFVARGAVSAESEGQLWSLVFRIGDRALADKSRIMARLARVEGPESDVAQQWRARFARAERLRPDGMELELDAMLLTLGDPRDREILMMWLMGHTHVVIAQELHMAPPAVRKRWERICGALRDAGGTWIPQ